MYYEKTSGGIVYETLDELLDAEITSVNEDERYYYIRTKTEFLYNNEIWKVSKRTGKAKYMMYTDFFVNVEDKTTTVSVDEFRKRHQRKQRNI